LSNANISLLSRSIRFSVKAIGITVSGGRYAFPIMLNMPVPVVRVSVSGPPTPTAKKAMKPPPEAFAEKRTEGTRHPAVAVGKKMLADRKRISE
jgi:hypothetical protein